MNKRILFFLNLFLFLLVTPVSGQDNLTYKNWSLTENNTGWTVTKYTGNESAVTIPEMINEIPVTQLAAELFMWFIHGWQTEVDFVGRLAVRCRWPWFCGGR